MKTCLVAINSKYIHENLAVHSLRAFAVSQNIDCSSGEFKKCEYKICEYTINQPYEFVLRKLYAEGADIYAFSVYIWNISFVMRIAQDLFKICPDVKLWLGGPEVSFNAEQILKEHPFITGVMRREGEETFSELMKAYSCGEDLKTIAGISYRDENAADAAGAIVTCIDRKAIDMDRLVFPYTGMDIDPTRIYYYESSRGCPFCCSYCLSSVDKSLRFRNIETVKEELGYFIDKRIPQVKFVDRTFNCERDRAYRIWQFIRENDNGVTNFHFEISADLLRKEDIELLKSMRPGSIQLEIGVQSINPVTLNKINRKTDLEKLYGNVRELIDNHNIHVHLDLIAGLPYEDMPSFRKSFNAVYALKPLQLQLGFLKVLKGTEMEKICSAAHAGYRYSEYPPYEILSTPWISYAELSVLKDMTEMIEIFYNSRQFEKTIDMLEKNFTDCFELYYRLSEFYVSRHYDEVKHARIRLYEILLEFIDECGFERSGYVPLLLKDAYAREKLKRFPDWARGYEHTVSFDYDNRDPLTNNAYPSEA